MRSTREHADPHGEQLRELQRLLIRLIRGDVEAARSDVVSSSDISNSSETKITSEEWSASLP